ncbi:alpha/beta hydrolase [Amycolatopsis rhizosphaerae]|uniref:Alpha/beta hydrolase n=1 Tax=Amycolatopsis rhizosphaerae TaxID=2053003 RepID=A0A558CJ93_9PSEU|nr:alpha/beta hydrolase [Amycolatopsis rhizosphaerae]TVT48804.1 alpha/beta hydrolase [Amycolatopsis rhizosphaerae]
MRLDPPVQQFLDVNTREREFLAHLGVRRQRQYMRLLIDLNFLRFGRPGPAVHSVTDHAVTTVDGEIRCRMYRPSGRGPLPAHLAFHGGGWWQGSIDDLVVDALCRQRCAEANLVVVSVDYRLAPEHPFPAGLSDGFAAFHWIVRNAEQFGIDPGTVSVGGSSAGANIAAALTIKLRDNGSPQPVLQLLEVPVVDLTLTTARHVAATTGGERTVDDLEVAVGHYLRDAAQARHPLASPLFADDLSGLPPAVIFTAEHDLLRLDGERYGARLDAAGVPARVVPHPGALHGTAMITRTWDPAARWQQEAATVLREAHWGQAGLAAG